jgi:hypothetical protein
LIATGPWLSKARASRWPGRPVLAAPPANRRSTRPANFSDAGRKGSTSRGSNASCRASTQPAPTRRKKEETGFGISR